MGEIVLKFVDFFVAINRDSLTIVSVEEDGGLLSCVLRERVGLALPIISEYPVPP